MTISHSPLLVTGSAGFIGTNFVLDWVENNRGSVISLDKLTYAGNSANLARLGNNPDHLFVQGDICDRALVAQLLTIHKPAAIIHFAAESHVDHSIDAPENFIHTNIVGTFNLLECTRTYLENISGAAKKTFRFLHVSTDEIYGSLMPHAPAFTEANPAMPNSPYAASKAASDHLVRAYHHTYSLPTLTTNCSNNYGPYQFPEKLIPLLIHNALAGKPMPVYGDGQNIRDWLYVGDHCAALRRVLESGRPGDTYAIGGDNERKNIDVAHIVCDILDHQKPLSQNRSYRDQIVFVPDRLGHDRRYAIDARKMKTELSWQPQEHFMTGIEKTVLWYLDNSDWVKNIGTRNET